MLRAEDLYQKKLKPQIDRHLVQSAVPLLEYGLLVAT